VSIRCDAATDRARVASAPSGSVTLMFWSRWSSFPTQYQAVAWSGDTTPGANAYDASAMLVNGNPANTVEFWLKNSSAPRMGPTGTLAADTWYHWAITYGTANGAACELFQNGVSVATGTAGSAAAFQTEETQFGNDANSDENPQCRIMAAKMYNRILTAAEIRAEMYSVLPVSADSLWGCWSLFDAAGGLDDLSGNGRPLVQSNTLTVESNDCGVTFEAPMSLGGWNRTAAAGGAISGSASLAFSSSGAIAGAGAIAGSVSMTFTPAAAVSGAGAIAGSAALAFSPAAAIAGAGAIAANATITFTPAGAITGAGSIAGSAALAFSPAATLLGAGAIAGSAALTFAASMLAGSPGTIGGSAALVFVPTAQASGAGAIAGSSALAFSPAAALQGAGAIAGSAVLVFSASASFPTGGAISGSASIFFSPVASVVAVGSAAGAAALSFSAVGTLVDLNAILISATRLVRTTPRSRILRAAQRSRVLQ
jgi:hypothetical protein